jgi:hypothetical protein
MKKSSFAFTSFKNNVNVMRDGEDINMIMHKDFKANCKENYRETKNALKTSKKNVNVVRKI